MDPFVARLVIALIAVPAVALAVVQIERLKQSVEARRVADYVRRVQPQLTADPRFRYVKLIPYLAASGCVSNGEALASLKSFLEASKPPLQVSLSLVSTTRSDWAWEEDHERLLKLAEQGHDLENRADALLEVFGNRGHFLTPSTSGFVKTLPEFQSALGSVEHRLLAVIKIPAVGYTDATNQAAEYAAILRRCGFRDIEMVVTGWGMTFPYSAP